MINSAGADVAGKPDAQTTHSTNVLPDVPSTQPVLIVPPVVEELSPLIVMAVPDIDVKLSPVIPLIENWRSLGSCPTSVGLVKLSVSVICNVVLLRSENVAEALTGPPDTVEPAGVIYTADACAKSGRAKQIVKSFAARMKFPPR